MFQIKVVDFEKEQIMVKSIFQDYISYFLNVELCVNYMP